jgi:hypothetical protein
MYRIAAVSAGHWLLNAAHRLPGFLTAIASTLVTAEHPMAMTLDLARDRFDVRFEDNRIAKNRTRTHRLALGRVLWQYGFDSPCPLPLRDRHVCRSAALRG